MNPELRGRLLAHSFWSEMESITKIAEESRVQEIFGQSIQQINERRAVGVPVVEPPPGYIYRPELQQFVPDRDGGGWITDEQARVAQHTADAYEAGQQELGQQMAQQELDQHIGGQIEEQQAAAAQEQQQAEIQQALEVEEQRRQMRQQSREQQSAPQQGVAQQAPPQEAPPQQAPPQG